MRWAGIKLDGVIAAELPNLYQKVALAAGTFNDITSGDNGDYKADPGWDACSGWGSPNGARILKALSTGGSGGS